MKNEFVIYRISTKKAVKISLRDGVFPKDLAELENKIKSGDFTKEQMYQCQKLGWDYAENILNRPLKKSFVIEDLDGFTWEADIYINIGSRGDVINKNVLQDNF